MNSDLTPWPILAHFSPGINPAAPVLTFFLSFAIQSLFLVPWSMSLGLGHVECFIPPVCVSTRICPTFDPIPTPCILLQSFADDVSSIGKAISPISEWLHPTHSLKPSSYATSPVMSLQSHPPPDSQTHLCGPPLKDLSHYLLYLQ